MPVTAERSDDAAGAARADDDPAPPAGYEPIVSSNAFAGRNGPVFEQRRADGGWVRGFRALSYHCNAGGIVHGGMMMTFADIVLARAVLDIARPPFATLRLVSDFAGPAPLGSWVSGTARCVAQRGSVIYLDGRIDADGAPALILSGLFKLRRPDRTVPPGQGEDSDAG